MVILDSGFPRLEAQIKKTLQKSLKALKKNNVVVDVYLIKDAEIKRLNALFKKKNKATNVLSFPASGKFPRPDVRKSFRHLGEIYLAPDYIQKHNEDIRHLAVHGLLHLLGYTHKGKRDRIRMEALEAKLHSKVLG